MGRLEDWKGWDFSILLENSLFYDCEFLSVSVFIYTNLYFNHREDGNPGETFLTPYILLFHRFVADPIREYWSSTLVIFELRASQ